MGDSNRKSLDPDTLGKHRDQQIETELHFAEKGSGPFTSCSYMMFLSAKENKLRFAHSIT